MDRPIYKYTDCNGQVIEFVIPAPHNKICINVSGGADSAILLLMLVNYCHKHIPDAEIHVITCANVRKGWYNAKWSSTVIDRVLQITGTQIIKSHYTYYADDQRRAELNATEKMLRDLHGITITIHGTTQNPPLSESDLLEGRHEPRDAGHGRPAFTKLTEDVVRWMPVMNVDKRMIAYLYEHFGMLDDLLPFTRSCEQHSKDNTDNPTWMMTHCGKCWWCREREWAFKNAHNK